ncbi:hypothetical protein KEM52_005913 [Ascosphaera acerosa]|nr:hypothetical protein KEM52_005913 [Ascosphaera acerosa]
MKSCTTTEHAGPTRLPVQKILDILSDSIRCAAATGDVRLIGSLKFIQDQAATELGYLKIVDNALHGGEKSRDMRVFKKVVRRVMKRVNKGVVTAPPPTKTHVAGPAQPSAQGAADTSSGADADVSAETVDSQPQTTSTTTLRLTAKRSGRRRDRKGFASVVDPNLLDTTTASNTTTATSSSGDPTKTTPKSSKTISTRRTAAAAAAAAHSTPPESPVITRTDSAASDHSSTSSLSSAKSVDLTAEALTGPDGDKSAGDTASDPIPGSDTARTSAAAASAADADAEAEVSGTAVAASVAIRKNAQRAAKKRKPRYQKPYAKGVDGQNLRGPVLTAAQQERYAEASKLDSPDKRRQLLQDLPEVPVGFSHLRSPPRGTKPVKETEDGPYARRKARLSAARAVGAQPVHSRRRQLELEIAEAELDEIQSPVDITSSEESGDEDGPDSAVASEAGAAAGAAVAGAKHSSRAAAAKAREHSRSLVKRGSRRMPQRGPSTQGNGLAGTSTALRFKKKASGTGYTALAAGSARRVTRGSAPNSARPSAEPMLRDSSEAEGSQINDDYCHICGGSGELLCCDGCVHSFHFTCLEPPMDPKNPPEGQWFCPDCTDKYEAEEQAKAATQSRAAAAAASAANTGVALSTLLGSADSLPSQSFQLPAALRNYYAGIKTGEHGEYAAVAVLPKKDERRWAKTYASDERSNAHLYALTDNKGKFIFCVACGRGSGGNKPIQICSYCPCAWHLDCLPFPVVNPSYQRPGSEKPYHHWRCPNHIDHDLRLIRSVGGRLGNFKQPRNPRWLDIEVIPSNEDFNAGPVGGHPSYVYDDEDDRDATTIRVQEKGLVMNFVARVKQENAVDAALHSYYRALVNGQTAEWRQSQLENAPQDLLIRALVETDTDRARQLSRIRRHTRTRSEPPSRTAVALEAEGIPLTGAPSASESDAVMGLLAMRKGGSALATESAAQEDDKVGDAINDTAERRSTANRSERLTELLTEFISLSKSRSKGWSAIASAEEATGRRAKQDMPVESTETTSAPSDCLANTNADTAADADAAAAAATAAIGDTGDTTEELSDRLSMLRQRAREEQLQKDEQHDEQRVSLQNTVKGKGKGKRSRVDGSPAADADAEAETEAGDAAELDLLRSIMACARERMQALGA